MAASFGLRDIKRALRNGPYAWPGGYPLYFACDDGGVLCFACVRKQWREIVSAHRRGERRGGWHLAGWDTNWEDPALICDHCNARIESAYAEDEAGAEDRAET
jgi:hypothetical protein